MKTNRYGIRRGRHTPPQVCKDLVAQFRRTGGTQAAFCCKHGLNAKTFARWVKRFESGDDLLPVRFAEVCVSPLAGLPVEVVLRNGVRMRISDVSDIARLAAQLEGIGAPGC